MGNEYLIHNGDATAGFSGFLYQADIALLKALEKIESIGDDETKLKKWSLEVEGEEDFTLVQKDHRGEIILKELYQVKEYEKGTPGDYLDGIIKLYQCTISNLNNGINCKTFICSKVKITGISDETSKIITKLKESKDKDILFQKCFCNLGISELEIQVEEYNSKEGSNKKKTIVSDYYHKNEGTTKIIDEEKKQKIINVFKIIDLTDFETNFDFGDIDGFGTFDVVQDKITELIKSIRPGIIKPNNCFKFLESKIKRKIQENKGLKYEDRDNITFLEIKEEIIKEELNFSKEDYQDMLINIFIKKFNEKFGKIYSTGFLSGNIKNISNEIDDTEKYDKFLNEIRKTINESIFFDKHKTFGFIKYTIGNQEVENIEDISNFNGLDKLIEKITGFDDKIIKKIQMIVSYIYSKANNGELKEEFCGEKFLSIFYKDKRGILTGLINDPEYLADFLQSNIFYRYEKTHIGIYGVDKDLYEHLGEEKEEPGFIGSLEEKDKEKFEKIKKWGITETKMIKIFSGKNCLKEAGERNAENFMN